MKNFITAAVPLLILATAAYAEDSANPISCKTGELAAQSSGIDSIAPMTIEIIKDPHNEHDWVAELKGLGFDKTLHASGGWDAASGLIGFKGAEGNLGFGFNKSPNGLTGAAGQIEVFDFSGHTWLGNISCHFN